MKKLLLILCASPLLFSSCGSGAPKYSECECVEFMNTHIMSLYDNSSSRVSEINECVKSYVYNKEDGRLNINSCFDDAWDDVKRIPGSIDVAFEFAARAMDCNCE